MFVEGPLQSKTYTDDGGTKRSRVEVIAENLILLSRAEQGDRAVKDPSDLGFPPNELMPS